MIGGLLGTKVSTGGSGLADQTDAVAIERERAAKLCERLATIYAERGDRECCIGALKLAASRIRMDDETAKIIGDAARRIRKRGL